MRIDMLMRDLRIITAFLILLAHASILHGQQTFKRILMQDSTLNNLVDPPGYKTAKPGTLGDVVRKGKGPQAMILIPGLGFRRKRIQ